MLIPHNNAGSNLIPCRTLSIKSAAVVMYSVKEPCHGATESILICSACTTTNPEAFGSTTGPYGNLNAGAITACRCALGRHGAGQLHISRIDGNGNSSYHQHTWLRVGKWHMVV